MLHQRSMSGTSVGPMGGTRPTLHSEHPPSIPRFAQHKFHGGDATDAFPIARQPASFTRSASSRNTSKLTSTKRPSSRHSSRQSSSDSIESATTTASSFTRTSPSRSESGSGEEDDLIQVVYTSSARSRHLPIDEVKSILRASRANNTGKGITGLLLYRDGSFVQFLEGAAHAVDLLYETIERDQRHHGVICVLRRSITKRDFRQWNMAFRDLDMIKRQSPLSSKFYEDDGESAPEEVVNEGFSQLMNVGLRVGDASDNEYRPDAMGNAKLNLPGDMSASMRKLVTTFYRLMDRPL